MEKKLKKQRNLIMVLIIVSLLFIIIGINCKISVFAENSDSHIFHTQETLENIMYDMTNGNFSNNIDLDSYCESRYAQNATIKWGARKQMQVFGDDDIVNFIPKQLFKEVGKTQFIGKKYGFFIETKKPSENKELLLSTIILLKITYTNNMLSTDSISRLKIKVTPVFQADFVCLNKNDEKSYSLDEQKFDFFKENYLYDVYVEYLSEKEEIIAPVPTFEVPFTGAKIFFSQHNKFYLTNASNVTSLYNVNDLNPVDNGYNAKNDMGCFFTQTIFAYNGSFIQKGGNSLKDVGEIAFHSATFAFDLLDKAKKLKSVFKAIPVIGQIVDTINLAQDIKNSFENMRDYKETELKKVDYESMYTNKDQQIFATGGLMKDAAIAITSVNDNKLIFGKGDYFEFDYQINCQDISVDTMFATMLNIGVVPVVSINQYNVEVGEIYNSTSVFTDELINHTTDGYKEIPKFNIDKLDGNFDIYMTSEQKSVAQIGLEFSGQYDFEFCKNNKFKIYEIDKNFKDKKNYYQNAIIIGESILDNNKQILNNVILEKDKIYYIEFEALDNKIEGKKTFEIGSYVLKISFIPQEINFGENSVELKFNDNCFKFQADKNVYYSFDLDNLDCKIKLFDKYFNLIEDGLNKEKLFVLNLNEPYYILIDKTSCKEVDNVNFTIKDEIHITLENIDKVPSMEKLYKHSVVGNTKLPVLCIPGYTFEGWWTSLDRLGDQVTDENINDLINQPEFTLYAKWTVIEYDVEYIANGGSEIENGKYIIEHIYELRHDTYKEGYLLYGWYDNPEFNGEKIERIEQGNFGNRTFYAKWIQEKFNVNLNVNSDTTDKIQATISETQCKVTYKQHFVLPVPEIRGFVFEGWVDVNNENNKYTNAKGESLHIYLQETDIELIAKWKREEYYIGFDNDGQLSWLTRSGDIFDISAEKESIKYNPNLCPNCNVLTYLTSKPLYPQQIDKNFFQEGHIFTNMLTNKNDQSSIACWHNTIFDLEDGQTIVLYVGYRKETNFKLHLLVDNEQSDEIVYKKIFTGDYNDELVFNLSDFKEKPGYKLASLIVHNNLDDRYNGKYAGTHLAPNKEFYVFNSSKQTMPDLSIGLQLDGEDIFLEAVYVPLEYVVSLYVDNNLEYNKVVVYDAPYNTSIGNGFPVPQKLGFDFKGWWSGKNGTGSLIADENGSLVKNIWNIPNDYALYAKFEYTKYRITFILDGGEALKNPPLYYTMENAQELPTTSKYGYIFEGWKNSNDVILVIPKGSTGDLVLTAKWKGVLTDITSAGTYTIVDEIAIVNFSKAGVSSKVLINVATSVKQISIIGSTEQMKFKTIDVAARTDELIMRLKNVNIIGHDNRAAIHALNCNKLTLECVGKNYLQSGTISSNNTNGAALTCRDIVIKGDELYVTGASSNYHIGKDGTNGDAAILGGGDHPEGIMIIYIKKLECRGGNGSDGKSGEKGADTTSVPSKAAAGKPGATGYTGGKGGDGGRGGNGGYGILFWGQIEITRDASVIGIGGNGGNGGNGGAGGKGGTGGEGGDAKFPLTGKNGGQGGTGGQGGFYGEGGKMGFGLSYTRISKQGSCTDTFGKDGRIGNVGAGGEGGDGGLGGYYLGQKKRHDTGPKGQQGPSGGTIVLN